MVSFRNGPCRIHPKSRSSETRHGAFPARLLNRWRKKKRGFGGPAPRGRKGGGRGLVASPPRQRVEARPELAAPITSKFGWGLGPRGGGTPGVSFFGVGREIEKNQTANP